MINPTKQQIENAKCFGWEYEGEGLFCRGSLVGYLDKTKGFIKI